MAQRLPFSEQLKRERLRRNWSQAVLAERIGCDTKSVKRWERGQGLPLPYYRQRICKLFGKNAEEFGLLDEQQTSLSSVSNMQETVLPPLSVEDEVVSSQETGNGASPSSSKPPMQESASSSDDMDGKAQTSSQASSTQDTSRKPFSSPKNSTTVKEVRLPPQPEPMVVYDIHPKWIVALSWEPRGERIASAGGDGTVHVWNTKTKQHLQTYRGHESKGILAKTPFLPTAYAVAWAPDGSRIASAGNGKAVHVWNPDTGATALKYTGHSGVWSDVFALAWSPDGTHIASACSSVSMDHTIHIWNATTGETVLRYPTRCGWLPSFSVLALAWAPNGLYIASTCSDKNVHIWDARNGGKLAVYTTPSDWVRDLAWSPDSRWLAVANGSKADNSIQLWDTLTGKVALTYSGHTDSIRNIAWSPNGAYIASASNDHTVRVWSPLNGETFSIYRGHTHWATAVAWSPDGSRIASASNDKTVQIWQPFAMVSV